MILSPHEIAFVASWAGFTGAEIVTAVAVALAESKGDTDIMGRSTTGENLGQRDHGLWQISGRWHGTKLQATPDWRDPYVNATLAKQVWDEAKKAGKDPWTPWKVYGSGSYKTYLPDATIAVKAPFPPVPYVHKLAARTGLEKVGADVKAIRNHFA
jgi:hypothetical protein